MKIQKFIGGNRMSKIITIVVLALLMVVQVSATTYVDQFLGIHYEEKTVELAQEDNMCDGEFVLKAQVDELNSIPIVIEALDAFDDGYHVVFLSKGEYMGSQYYTIKKDNGKIAWIKNDFCPEGEYESYELNIDLNNLEDNLTHGLTIQEGYNLLRNIKGLSIFQKFHIMKTAISHSLSEDAQGVMNG